MKSITGYDLFKKNRVVVFGLLCTMLGFSFIEGCKKKPTPTPANPSYTYRLNNENKVVFSIDNCAKGSVIECSVTLSGGIRVAGTLPETCSSTSPFILITLTNVCLAATESVSITSVNCSTQNGTKLLSTTESIPTVDCAK